MKKRYAAIALFLILFAMYLQAGNSTNFTGAWVLDESKLEANDGGPRMAATKLTITQDEKEITIERFMSDPFRGDFTMTEKVTLDGKETVNTSDFGDLKMTASWSEDGKTLTIKSAMEMNRDGQTFHMNSTEIWTIVPENNALKIDQTRTSPRGDMQSVLYYNKEKK